MEKKPYAAPNADEIVIESTDILLESVEIKTNQEGSGSDTGWGLFELFN